MPAKKEQPNYQSLVIPDPRETWSAYLGHSTRPLQTSALPPHDFAADPAALRIETWQERPFRCRKHAGCGCLPLSPEWAAALPCKECLECGDCEYARGQFRLSFLAGGVEEIAACERDWRRFDARYLFIRTTRPGASDAVRPEHWERQHELIDILLEGLIPSKPMVSDVHDHTIWKDRSLGVSERVIATTALLHSLFRAMAVTRCFSVDKNESRRWLSQIQDYMWARLPYWLRPPRNPHANGRANQTSMQLGWFENHALRGQQSTIESHSGPGRGGPATFLVFDEVAAMKDYFDRYQSAGPATSLAKGKTVSASTPKKRSTAKAPMAAAEFRRLCVENGGAEVMQARWDMLKAQTGLTVPPVPPGLFDVWNHKPGWSGHFFPWHQCEIFTPEHFRAMVDKFGEEEFPTEPMEGFAEDEEGTPFITVELLDEQERLNAAENLIPLLGGLVPVAFAGHRTPRERIRGGFAFVPRDEIMANDAMRRNLCGMPQLETEQARDRFELERMRIELLEDLTGLELRLTPLPGENTLASADPSDGGADGDAAALTIWSLDRQCDLLSWDGRLYQECLGDLTVCVMRWFHNGQRQSSEAVVDTTKAGCAATVARTIEQQHERVFYRKARGSTGKTRGERRSTPGFKFTPDTKRESGDALNTLLANGRTRLRDAKTIAQLRKIVWRTIGGKRELVTRGATHAERADDRASTVLVAAALQTSAQHYRMGVRPGQSLQEAAEKERRRMERSGRVQQGRQSPGQEGRIRFR